MDYYTILAQKTLLAREFEGHRVDAVRRLGDYSFYISFDTERALKLNCTPDMPYIHCIEKAYMPIKKAQNWFPKKLSGIPLKNITIIPGDRVLTFEFDSEVRLISEMTGRHANTILVDTDNLILGTMRKVTSRQSGVREVRPGAEYQPPPARDFPDIIWSSLQSVWQRMLGHEASIQDVFAKTVAAGSRIFSAEACMRAGVDGCKSVADMSDDELFRLLKTAAEMVSVIERGGEGATIIATKDSLPKDVFPLTMQSQPDARYFDEIDESIERYAMERERGLERSGLKKSIETSLNRVEKGLVNTLEKVMRERGGESEPEELERKGNTILANVYQLSKGMVTIEADDPYGGPKLTIALDPKLDAPANATKYFNRARKLREASKRAKARIAELESRIDELRQKRERSEPVEDLKTLKKLAAEHARVASSSGSGDDDRPFPRRFTSSAGLEIIVGRNDKENDALLKWASKNDFWLHAQNIAGSHVILKTPGRNQQPDKRSVEQAAGVAAWYSKGKTSALVPVACTLLKYVVKRRGQGPGQVNYTREKVVFAEPGLPG